RPILDAETAEDEKKTLNKWITDHADDPMYRFGHQQVFSVVDPSSQTEDLGDDAIKASTYGIANLKRIVPNLQKWTTKEGETYEDLKTMHRQVLAQFNRYMGHVSNNIGGVYEYYKAVGQDGAVYTHVPKDHQKNAMKFLNEELFNTPTWMIDKDIIAKTEYTGIVERMRQLQERTLNNILDLGRMARMIENETLNGNEAYTLLNMMSDLRSGVWSELRTGRTIDTYRRNLQRAHLDRLNYLMTIEKQNLPNFNSPYFKPTRVTINQSDIRSVARAELERLKRDIRASISITRDRMSRYHLQDALERINRILDPK
ncbi:MAG: zinc-dependent metalloprotease, partial [Flavobacteriaceae bacterium]|nr:zinc-dependent metalloprotease [Flavobacteriaceae bacterium]